MLNMGFYNGGPAAIVWGCLLAGVGNIAVASSLAEMAAMDPAVGAQYRWSARFARSNNEFWGLLQGTWHFNTYRYCPLSHTTETFATSNQSPAQPAASTEFHWISSGTFLSLDIRDALMLDVE